MTKFRSRTKNFERTVQALTVIGKEAFQQRYNERLRASQSKKNIFERQRGGARIAPVVEEEETAEYEENQFENEYQENEPEEEQRHQQPEDQFNSSKGFNTGKMYNRNYAGEFGRKNHKKPEVQPPDWIQNFVKDKNVKLDTGRHKVSVSDRVKEANDKFKTALPNNKRRESTDSRSSVTFNSTLEYINESKIPVTLEENVEVENAIGLENTIPGNNSVDSDGVKSDARKSRRDRMKRQLTSKNRRVRSSTSNEQSKDSGKED